MLGWIILIVAAVMFIVGVVMWFNGHVEEAVETDRAVSGEVVRNTQVEAERSAAADAEQDRLVAERAQAQQMEAINESMQRVDGDPTAAVYDRLRRSPTTPH